MTVQAAGTSVGAMAGGRVAWSLQQAPTRLEAVALQQGDPAVRDVFVHLAGGGAITYSQLAASLLDDGRPPRAMEPRSVDWRWMAALARVVGLQNVAPDDTAVALALYRHLHERDHVASYGDVHVKLFADLLLSARCDAEAEALLRTGAIGGTDRALIRADLRNPWRGGPFAASPTEWIADFQRGGLFDGSPGLAIADHGLVPFDRLAAEHAPQVVADALITVIFPVYRPAETLRHALRSVLEQTWSDLEVLVVDDGSGPAYRDFLQELAASDPRVRLIVCEENRGAYAARNRGLALARGRFVAFHDHDDWSHPRRLERQVRPLLDDSRLVATHSRCARVDESLVFVHPGYHPIRHNASSLMIRRRDVVLGVGHFDEVRKGADSEYHARIVAHFGRDAVENMRDEAVLAAVRRLDRSLSRSDFRAGWHHPDRIWYRDSYRQWHRRAGPANVFVDRRPESRPFTAPRSFVPEPAPAPELDVVLLADWHADASITDRLVEWCRKAHTAGRRIGAAHRDSLAHTVRLRPSMHRGLVDLVHAGLVEYVAPHDDCRIGVLLVAHPSLLDFSTRLAVPWTVRRTVVLGGLEPSAPGLDDALGREAANRAQSIFGGNVAMGHELPSVTEV